MRCMSPHCVTLCQIAGTDQPVLCILLRQWPSSCPPHQAKSAASTLCGSGKRALQFTSQASRPRQPKVLERGLRLPGQKRSIEESPQMPAALSLVRQSFWITGIFTLPTSSSPALQQMRAAESAQELNTQHLLAKARASPPLITSSSSQRFGILERLCNTSAGSAPRDP